MNLSENPGAYIRTQEPDTRCSFLTPTLRELTRAALKALGCCSGDGMIETLQDPTSQIRAAALASLASLAKRSDADGRKAAGQLLVDAIARAYRTGTIEPQRNADRPRWDRDSLIERRYGIEGQPARRPRLSVMAVHRHPPRDREVMGLVMAAGRHEAEEA